MPELESVYLRLPVALQELAVSAVGWRTRRTRYDRTFRAFLREAEERDRWSDDLAAAFRDRQLAKAVAHAAAAVPHWREAFRAAGLDPSAVSGLADLAALPTLTKTELQAAPDRFSASGPGLPRAVRVHTSGTTGTGLHLLTCREAVRRQWATFWRFCGRHGIPFLAPCALFAGRSVVPAAQQEPPYWRFSRPTRQLVFSAYHMRRETLDAYVGELRRRRIPWLHGYPSTISLVAAHLLEHGLDLGYDIRWVTVSSETLLPHQARTIERAFGVRPRQHYSNTEGVAAISECELGGLHVDEDFAAVELVEQGTLTRLVGTSLWNPCLPLLRYETGDHVSRRGPCPCGRPGRVVAGVDGRIEGYVVLRDGSRVGRMDHVFKDMVNVREAQIVQTEPGAIVLRIVRGERFAAEDERRLLAEVRKRLGDRAAVSIEYPERLERTAGGKLRFVVAADAQAEAGLARTGGGGR
jgi:phenylacetate-CoA ligase